MNTQRDDHQEGSMIYQATVIDLVSKKHAKGPGASPEAGMAATSTSASSGFRSNHERTNER